MSARAPRARRTWCGVLLALGLAGAGLQVRVGGGPVPERAPSPRIPTLDLEAFSPEPPGASLDLVMIHHSCGAQLLADPGPESADGPVLLSHPNGGGLRRLLESNGYRVNEATYGSRIGERTDIFDWPPKFSEEMDAVLSCRRQDETLPAGRRNRIVVFKSCYPNNRFVGEGRSPGTPAGPELTVWNARAAYASLLEPFTRRPDVLFVGLTAPPLAPALDPVPLWKHLLCNIRGRDAGRDLARGGELARAFNGWLRSPDGWLRDYPAKNVVVFDTYDLFTDGGKSNLSRFASRGGRDSHPDREGNRRAAEALAPFLNRAVRRAGLTD